MASLNRSGTIPEARLKLQSLAIGPASETTPFFRTSVPILSTPKAFVFFRLEIILVICLAFVNLKVNFDPCAVKAFPFRCYYAAIDFIICSKYG